MSTPEIRTNGDSSVVSRNPEWEQILEALRGLRFGSVNIVVQDGVVVQVDRTEKRRLRFSSQGTAKSANQQRAC